MYDNDVRVSTYPLVVGESKGYVVPSVFLNTSRSQHIFHRDDNDNDFDCDGQQQYR